MHEGTKKKKIQKTEKMDRKKKCEQNSKYLFYSQGILKKIATKIDLPSFCVILSAQNFSILATFPITHIPRYAFKVLWEGARKLLALHAKQRQLAAYLKFLDHNRNKGKNPYAYVCDSGYCSPSK